MSKTKKTAPKTARKKNRAPLPAPTGASRLLSMIGPGDVDAIYKRACKLRNDIRRSSNGIDGFEVSLDAVKDTRLVYPNTDNPKHPENCLAAGVRLGAAVAWMLMTELQGGAR